MPGLSWCVKLVFYCVYNLGLTLVFGLGLDTFRGILGGIFGGLVPLVDLAYILDYRLLALLGVLALV